MEPKPHQYRKNPEFKGLEAFVWEYLNQIGSTIPQIEKGKDRTHGGDPGQRKSGNEPIWHTKAGLDEFVARSLNLRLEDYGADKSANPLYKAIANEISNLRKNDILIDWKKVKKSNTGMGVWRLDKTRIEEYARDRVEEEMGSRNYYSVGLSHIIFVRQKQNAFRAELLREYYRCVFCAFKLADYLIGAHIVPYSVMRKEDAENSMNPANGLLLCRMCDAAFELGSITVNEDLSIEVSEYLKEQTACYAKSWIRSIGTEITLKKNPRHQPDPKYLKWKKELIRGV